MNMIELNKEETININGGGFWGSATTIGAGTAVLDVLGMAGTSVVAASPVGIGIAVGFGLVAAYNYFK